jgi:general secretion pathway protein M
MTADRTIAHYLSRPLVALLLYATAVAAFVWIIFVAVSDLLERQRTVDAAADMLARLEGRMPGAPGDGGSSMTGGPTGSPFLEGQTVTVAGAALLQRVAAAVTSAGGNVLSSQVELQGAQSKDGYVSLIASCEIEHTALQALLYDIEAGMPFLFVDQLVAQAPTTAPEGGRMRVLLSVSGLWPGAKRE